MVLDFAQLEPAHIYHAMTQVIVPRPIAWILSLNEDQSYNLAPFSYFSGVCSKPPLISVSIGKKKDGSPKDTRRNILERKKFVIHIPSSEQAQVVTDSAKVFDYGESELNHLGLSLEPQDGFSMPILKGTQVAMECELHQHFEVGDVEQALILGKIHKIYAQDQHYTKENDRHQFDVQTIAPLARLGGKDYASLQPPFSISPSP